MTETPMSGAGGAAEAPGAPLRPERHASKAVLTALVVTVFVVATTDSALGALLWAVLGLLRVPVAWAGWSEVALVLLSIWPAWLLFRGALAAEREVEAERMAPRILVRGTPGSGPESA